MVSGESGAFKKLRWSWALRTRGVEDSNGKCAPLKERAKTRPQVIDVPRYISMLVKDRHGYLSCK
jgi:hypothetical protein